MSQICTPRVVSSFPHISPPEFEASCSDLCELYAAHRDVRCEWLAAETARDDSGAYLIVTKLLAIVDPDHDPLDDTCETEELDEDDEAALFGGRANSVTVEYHVILSPTYQVPVLYFSVKDPSFRFPPTMDTLRRHLIPTHFTAQTDSIGVLGGITVTDHPFTNTPVFFIHPCQTAALLKASLHSKEISPLQYLVLWIGAIGCHVGLHVPLSLAAGEPSVNLHSRISNHSSPATHTGPSKDERIEKSLDVIEPGG